MLAGLDSLNELATRKKLKPTWLQNVYYLFFDKGISLTEFNELPLPYIFEIINTHNYIKEQEKKAYANRK